MFETTPIKDLLIFRPKRHGDARGFFSETWSRDAFAAQGLAFEWCQDNHSLSRPAGVLRGLHYQAPPKAQAKLVRCTRGRVWDVAVDTRRGSPSYGRWFGLDLSAENGAQFLIPRGFLHGFLTLEPDSEVQYKVDNPYAADCDGAICWNDPDLAIDWPIAQTPALSARDGDAPRLNGWQSPFETGGDT
jgi:dTDP-4-dehydrorhamnose 3,5-epimerase